MMALYDYVIFSFTNILLGFKRLIQRVFRGYVIGVNKYYCWSQFYAGLKRLQLFFSLLLVSVSPLT